VDVQRRADVEPPGRELEDVDARYARIRHPGILSGPGGDLKNSMQRMDSDDSKK
jgi:hypothetical protein